MIKKCANIGRGVPRQMIVNNIARVIHGGGAVSWQEIDEADQFNNHDILEAHLPKGTIKVGWDTTNPITLPDRFVLQHEEVTKACDGLAEFTPERFLVTAIVSLKDRPHVGTFAFVNGHDPINRPETQSRREEMQAKRRDEVDSLVNAGLSTIWDADVNTLHYPLQHENERTLAKSGLSVIRFVPAKKGMRFHEHDRGGINLTIDGHDAPWCRGSVTA